MTIEHHTLSNGINVLIIPDPDAEKATLRHYYRVGSRHEREEENGIAHFLEHMFYMTGAYKDVVKRGWKIDGFDAATGKDDTTYTLEGIPSGRKNMRRYNTLLTDMTVFPSFSEKYVVIEREAVLQEMAARQDNLSGMARDNISRVAFPDSALGRDIIGDFEDIRKFSAEMCHDFAQRYYHKGNLVISVLGNIEPDSVLEDLEKTTSRIPDGELRPQKAPRYSGGTLHEPRNESNQLNLALAFQSVAQTYKLAFATDLMMGILGGDYMFGSRLFREVREKRGLAYWVSADYESGVDYGLSYISTGVGVDRGDEVLSIIGKEIHKLQNQHVTKRELREVKEGYTKHPLDVDEILHLYNAFERVVSPHEIIDGYNAVTADDIMEAAQRVFSSTPILSSVGPDGSQPDYDKLVKALEM